MSIVIFILVIVALIVVHEFGHFVAAKLTGMRVDEFGLGYPPRAMRIAKVRETEYTLNWLPFGGFVKIYGENGEQKAGAEGRKSFTSKNRFAQAFVLVAGVAMNIIFAYVLITGALIAGTPRALSAEEVAMARDVELMVASVVPGSPAARAGLVSGDVIISAEDGHNLFESKTPEAFSKFVSSGGGNAALTLEVRHTGGEEEIISVRPEAGLITSDPARVAIGITPAAVGVVSLSFIDAVVEGATLTWGVTKLTAVGLWQFFYGIFTFQADLSQVAGPVGIAGVVGSASAQGAGYLLSIMAIISINLALINLIPVPALDGGRLLFVIIEGITRRPININVARALNGFGFAFLILLMVVVTAHDVFKIIH